MGSGTSLPQLPSRFSSKQDPILTSEFKSQLFRKRKLSDASLEKILRDPFVREAFFRYLQSSFGEKVLAFWLAIEVFQELPHDNEVGKRSMALEIYLKYFGPEVLPEEHVAAECDRRDVELLLDIKESNGKLQVGQKDLGLVEKAFNTTAAKAFQQLKFENMAGFLVSPEFVQLESHKEYFDSVQEAADKAACLLDDMGAAFIISHPVGAFHLTHFLSLDDHHADSTRQPKGLGKDLMDLYDEIRDFDSAKPASERRLQRLLRIMQHYKSVSVLPTFTEMIASFDASGRGMHKMKEQAAVVGLFDVTKREICAFIEKHYLEAFKQTPDFHAMSSYIATSTDDDEHAPHRLIASSFRVRQTTSHVKQLKEFRVTRKLSSPASVAQSFDSLGKVLADALGRLYFKRFCTQNFMEELIHFWIEVDSFEQARFMSPDVGTLIIPKEGEEEIQLRKRRALHMRDKYIVEGSRFEVNINTEMRERCVSRVDANESVEIFGEVRDEVFKLLQENLWAKFIVSTHYKLLLRKQEIKLQRNQCNARLNNISENPTAKRNSKVCN